MDKEIKENKGRLFEAKNSSYKSPSFVGKAVIQGKEWRVAVWENQASNGARYLNMDFDETWIWLDQDD